MEKFQVYNLIDKHYRDRAKEMVKQLSRAAGGEHNAEDVIQEAYYRACKYWKSYDGTKPFETWWTSILNNCLRDNQKDTILNGMVADDLAPVTEVAKVTADDYVLVKEMERAIEKQQPENARDALKYYFLLGYTSKEVSEITPYTPEAVRQIASRFKRDFFGQEATA